MPRVATLGLLLSVAFVSSVLGDGVTCPTLFNFYPDANDCTKFYRCTWGKTKSFTCPSGTKWSQELLTCDHGDKVKCYKTPLVKVEYDVVTGRKSAELNPSAENPDFSADLHKKGHGHKKSFLEKKYPDSQSGHEKYEKNDMSHSNLEYGPSHVNSPYAKQSQVYSGHNYEKQQTDDYTKTDVQGYGIDDYHKVHYPKYQHKDNDDMQYPNTDYNYEYVQQPEYTGDQYGKENTKDWKDLAEFIKTRYNQQKKEDMDTYGNKYDTDYREPYTPGKQTDYPVYKQPYAPGKQTAYPDYKEPYVPGKQTPYPDYNEPYAPGKQTAYPDYKEPYAPGKQTDYPDYKEPYMPNQQTSYPGPMYTTPQASTWPSDLPPLSPQEIEILRTTSSAKTTAKSEEVIRKFLLDRFYNLPRSYGSYSYPEYTAFVRTGYGSVNHWPYNDLFRAGYGYRKVYN